jgi:tetratricopeptide (TPR) repeat protein
MQGAKKELEELLKDTQPSYGTHFNYARILHEEGNIGGAIEHLRTAFRIKPAHVISHKLGDWLYTSEQYEEAAHYYRKCLVGMKDQTQVLNDLAYCYHHLGNHKESLRYSAKAVLYSPREHNIWIDLIASYLHVGKTIFFNDLEDLAD